MYFGTDNPPATKVSSGQTGTSLTRSGLSDNTTYYWKVVAKDNHGGSTSGQVWRYTTASDFVCGTSTVEYGGKTYNTVQIGTQCWFKENLDVGTMITGTSEQTNNSTIEKYCYDNNTANCNVYGGFYQWNEAMQYSTTSGTQGVCSAGWHIPTHTELSTLRATVYNDGNALKAVGQGTGGGAGTNTSGFSALLSGHRNGDGSFGNGGYGTFFWSSTENYPYAYDLSL
ncbi:MAG: hypothetical protein HYZ34_07685 [Ignavibacteriae bacterium]|nr:hypothetical protein [Ignavibacteriota bacterium]